MSHDKSYCYMPHCDCSYDEFERCRKPSAPSYDVMKFLEERDERDAASACHPRERGDPCAIERARCIAALEASALT